MTDTLPALEPPPPERRRRWPWLALGVVVLAGAATTLVVLQGDEDDDASPTPVTTPLPDPVGESDDPNTAELTALLQRGQGATYHARYSLSGSEAAAASGVTLEVWRDGDRLRQDTLTDVEGQQVQTSSLVLDGAVILCSKAGEGEWSCAESEPVGTESEGVIGSVREQLAGSSIVPRDDELEGRVVRCFAFTREDGTGDLCMTPEGIPTTILFEGVGITLDELDEDVPGTVFTPPADPVQGGAG